MSEKHPLTAPPRPVRQANSPKISRIELGEVIRETQKAAAQVEAVRLGAAVPAEDEHAEALGAERFEVAPSRSPG
ncbi:hypothetical protein [Amycolatopsis xylanica]|uniref:hypothetical protein n=1 Tax=Amycolatopsis xylanica TaxID=589385 RepID=UPI00115FF0F8|nr:hypothetical protein [Amycolatopsis xylanica]